MTASAIPVADGILRGSRQSGPGGTTRTEISNLFGRHRTSDQIGAALTAAQEEAPVVRSETRETNGRPCEVWVAVGGCVMTPGYLTALRESIRTRAKSAKSPQGTPLNALNTPFEHPEPLRESGGKVCNHSIR